MEATPRKPKTMAKLLPRLTGILSKDSMQTPTVRKQPPKTIAQTQTAEKVLKPLTTAKMRADILAHSTESNDSTASEKNRTRARGSRTRLSSECSRTGMYSRHNDGRPEKSRGSEALKVKSAPQNAASAKSSMELDKKISHTADGQMKNNSVRKALTSQSKPKACTNASATIHQQPSETPKIPKPEFRANKSLMQALKVKSAPQNAASAKSSMELDKKISHTADGQMKNNSVRKALTSQSKPKACTNASATIHQQPSETPKIPKPEFRANKSLMQALKVKSAPQNAASAKSSMELDKKISHTADGQMKNNSVRKALTSQSKPKACTNASATIHQQPSETPKIPKPEFRANKSLMQARNNVRISGICNIPAISVKLVDIGITRANKENSSNQANLIKKPVPKFNHKNLMSPVPDSPLSNESWKSCCDASFLQNEQEINDIEMKAATVSKERSLENIAEVTPAVSTPFKEYRNVQEYFNNSSELESSAMYHDNTSMRFDETANNKQENQREESVIVSLCELLNRLTVTNNDKISTELKEETELKEVERQRETNIKMIDSCINTLNNMKESEIKSLKYVRQLINEKRNSRITSKSEKAQSPNRDFDSRALNMYMKMKEQMNFLNTPLVKHRSAGSPDTPSVVSHNLQRQLDKLYCSS